MLLKQHLFFIKMGLQYKRTYQKKGSNAAALGFNFNYVSALRVRMSQHEIAQAGGQCNTARFVNKSAFDIVLSYSFDVERTDSILIRGGGTSNINIEDGRSFDGFDVYSADAANDIAIGDFLYNIARVT